MRKKFRREEGCWDGPPLLTPSLAFFAQVPLRSYLCHQVQNNHLLDKSLMEESSLGDSLSCLRFSSSMQTVTEAEKKGLQREFSFISCIPLTFLSILTSPSYQLLADETCRLPLSASNSVSTQQPEEPLYL